MGNKVEELQDRKFESRLRKFHLEKECDRRSNKMAMLLGEETPHRDLVRISEASKLRELAPKIMSGVKNTES